MKTLVLVLAAVLALSASSYAQAGGFPGLLERLISLGADVQAARDDGRTTLMYAGTPARTPASCAFSWRHGRTSRQSIDPA
jgi:hypothetical protein